MLTQKQVSEETHGRHIESAAGRGFATSPANSQAAEHLISPIVPIQPFVKPAFVQADCYRLGRHPPTISKHWAT